MAQQGDRSFAVNAADWANRLLQAVLVRPFSATIRFVHSLRADPGANAVSTGSVEGLLAALKRPARGHLFHGLDERAITRMLGQPDSTDNPFERCQLLLRTWTWATDDREIEVQITADVSYDLFQETAWLNYDARAGLRFGIGKETRQCVLIMVLPSCKAKPFHIEIDRSYDALATDLERRGLEEIAVIVEMLDETKGEGRAQIFKWSSDLCLVIWGAKGDRAQGIGILDYALQQTVSSILSKGQKVDAYSNVRVGDRWPPS